MSVRRRSILLVDDEALVRESLSCLLTEIGYRVRTAAHSAEAHEEIEKEAPDLILLDVHIGKHSGGLDLCRALRATRGVSRVPILILTGDGRRETVVEAVKSGANGFILKSSLMVHDLVARLEKALGNDPAAAGAPTDESAGAPG